MKKLAAFGIIAMILCVSAAVLFNIAMAKSLPEEGTAIEKVEKAVSQNIPFRSELSGLMDLVRYVSGVRHFGDIYIGSEGSLLKDIPAPTSRTYSVAKNYILSFGEKHQLKPYFMLVPTSAVILRQEIESYVSEDFYNQRGMINKMYSEFGGAVRTADIYQTLYDKRGEYIYYRTEDMPTSLGGYYIYTELCSRLGIEQNSMDTFSAAYAAHGFYGSLASDFFKPYTQPDFVTLYEYIGEEQKLIIEHFNPMGLYRISESAFVYDEEAYTDKTDMIFGGISPKMEISSIKSKSEQGSILIFGDETAKSWLPFLISNYSKITFVDLNACTEDLLCIITAEEYDQVLFAYSTATFAKGIDFEKLEYIK